MLYRCVARQLELSAGGPAPGGVRAANLTEATRPYLEEVALNEQVLDACAVPSCDFWEVCGLAQGSSLVKLRLFSCSRKGSAVQLYSWFILFFMEPGMVLSPSPLLHWW